MRVFKKAIQNITVSTDQNTLDLDLTYDYISNSYWAKGIPRETFEKSIQNGLCFGVYKNDSQIGFARVITDYSTIAYLGDVFIIEEERKRGYSKLLIESILEHPELQGLRRFFLVTKGAQSLYKKFGFKILITPENWMEIINSNIYEVSKS